jgi:hypothetical protein
MLPLGKVAEMLLVYCIVLEELEFPYFCYKVSRDSVERKVHRGLNVCFLVYLKTFRHLHVVHLGAL